MKLTKLLIFCFFATLFSVYGQAQDLIINGKVVDENGLPIPGASILIKGTTKATASDFDGNYQLKATSNGTLIFSFVGYSKVEEAINGRTRIEVKLNLESQSLQEVVVVGYGTQKKSVVTGAISSIKSKDLENIPNGRVEEALQGRVAGVTVASNAGEPGSTATIRVRGITTFDTYGGNNPLWVVDGVVVDSGGIGYINQNDIESMEVLKDAASLAIYGSRAASGVILVTTKKGKSGKIAVNYSGYSGSSAPAKTLNLLNATQYGVLMNERSVAGGGPVLFSNVSALGDGTDWQKAIFNKNAQQVSHELSMSGGNEVSTFYLSFGLQDQQGIVASAISNFNKKNIRLNSTHKISKIFTVGQTLGYTHQKSIGIGNTNSEFGGPLSSAINLDPITPLIITDLIAANQSPYTSVGVIKDSNGNPYGISNIVGQEMTNPLAYVQTKLGGNNWSDNFVGNAFLEITPLNGLKLKTSLGGKLAYWGFEGFTPHYYLNASSNNAQNNLNRATNQSFGWNIENTISYTKQLNKHDFTLLVGQGAYVDNITSGTNTTYFNLPVTSYQDASFNFNLPANQITASAYTGNEHVLSSLFSRLNYNYDEKYLFTGVIRRDGSSRFGSNNRYGTFPSFSAGWVISKEGFWKENKVVSTLKLRGGYGITGNDAIPDFGYVATISGGRNYTIGNSGNVTIGNSPNAPSNPDLKWEQTAQTNIGVDAKLFNSLNLTFEVYKKKTSGILQYVSLPGYVGATGSPLGNVADMENKGIEVELGYRKKFTNFNFSANGNVAYLLNKVTNLGQGKVFIPGDAAFQSMGAVTRTQVGQAYNTFYGYQTAGIFQNMADVNAYKNASGGLIQPNAVPGDFRWVDTNGDGTITAADEKFLGSPLPKYTFGLTLNLEYKGFDLMVFTQGAAGNKIFQGLRRLDIGTANYQTDALGRWNGEGTSNAFPRLTSNDTNGNFTNPSNFYLEDGDYLRLKIVQLGYSLPSDVINKIGASKIRLFLTGENLLTLTKYTGYDPEIGGNVMGIDRGYYPQSRTVMFGTNLQF
jgi:TonB-linked SusC/RagA family outer membrane protein